MITKEDKKKQGKKNRNSGKSFETKIRTHLEAQGYLIVRWSGNLDKDLNFIQAVPLTKFNPFTRTMQTMNVFTGFPDFLCFIPALDTELIGVECKVAKYLSAEEKAKCQKYIDMKIFSKIIVYYKGKKRGSIEHYPFLPEITLSKDSIQIHEQV